MSESSFANKILIVDEVHNVRNPKSKGFRAVLAMSKRAEKVLLLTGTPIHNYPHELSPLIHLIYPSMIAKDADEFEKSFGKTGLSKNRDYLRRVIEDTVMFYNPPGYSSGEATPDFPALRYKDVFVRMSSAQAREQELYSKGKRQRVEDVEKKSSFYLKQRQLCNDVGGSHPKLDCIVSNAVRFAGEGQKSVIYSFFAAKGIAILERMLERTGVPFASFTGKQKPAHKKRAVEAYNNDEIMVLLISDAGAEGLDLKHSRHVHICDPTWNESLTAQIVGRARRFRSHTSEKVEKLVQVWRYYCLYDKEDEMSPENLSSKNASADMLIRSLASRKDELCRTFLKKIVSWVR